MPKPQIFNMANMSFITISENKILSKISEFTVLLWTQDFQSFKVQSSQLQLKNFCVAIVFIQIKSWLCCSGLELVQSLQPSKVQ